MLMHLLDLENSYRFPAGGQHHAAPGFSHTASSDL